MALVKLADFYPNYKQDIFNGDDIKGYDVYSETDEKIGGIYDILLDDSGRFRYFVIDTGFWIFGKKVLLPIGRTRIDYDRHRVYATGMSKEQAERLPEYNENMTVDYDYEERVRNVYRPTATAGTTPTYNRDNYTYDHDRELYDTNEQNQQNLKLYEERLIASKNRQKTGEVAIGKHVETDDADVVAGQWNAVGEIVIRRRSVQHNRPRGALMAVDGDLVSHAGGGDEINLAGGCAALGRIVIARHRGESG